jgi:hypothetical protein
LEASPSLQFLVKKLYESFEKISFKKFCAIFGKISFKNFYAISEKN